MKKLKNFKYYFLILSIYLLSFQYLLENQISIFKYIDEVYSLLFIPFFFISSKSSKKELTKKNLLIIILLLVLTVIGLIPNITYHYQTTKYIIMDILLLFKFYLSVGLSFLLFDDNLFEKKNSLKIRKHLRFIILILSVATVANYIFNIWPNSNLRFGIMPNQVFFGHPTKLSAVLFFLLSLYNICNKGKIDKYYFLIYIMIFTTLRTKSLCALFCAIILLFYVKRKNNKIEIKNLILICILICLLGFNTFKYYFFSDGFARSEMMFASFKIADDYFPLGTGFGTFGSWPSGLSYSKVYYLYGLNHVWGMTPDNFSAIADSFWPTILGQFGYLGTTVYILILIKIFSIIQKEYSDKNKYIYISKLIAFMYLLISSTSESAFLNPLAVPLGIVIGSNVKKDKCSLKHTNNLIEEDKGNNEFIK